MTDINDVASADLGDARRNERFKSDRGGRDVSPRPVGARDL